MKHEVERRLLRVINAECSKMYREVMLGGDNEEKRRRNTQWLKMCDLIDAIEHMLGR